jgi:hypothetical protein
MALSASMRCMAPLRAVAGRAARGATVCSPMWRTSPGMRTTAIAAATRMGGMEFASMTPNSIFNSSARAVAATQARPVQTPGTALVPAAGAAAPVVAGVRAMSSWRLRPYAAAGTMAAVPMSSLSAGFSKVSLSLLVMPWKALPMALLLGPVAWALPAAYRMIFQNSMRGTTASVFTVLLYLVLSFMPVPCFENLFSDITFYAIALVSTFFMYTFFPEVLLHDFMFMHYLALFTVPLIPLAFAYMPMFAARTYLFL